MSNPLRLPPDSISLSLKIETRVIFTGLRLGEFRKGMVGSFHRPIEPQNTEKVLTVILTGLVDDRK